MEHWLCVKWNSRPGGYVVNEVPMFVALSSGYRPRGLLRGGGQEAGGGFINQPERKCRFPGCGHCLSTQPTSLTERNGGSLRAPQEKGWLTDARACLLPPCGDSASLFLLSSLLLPLCLRDTSLHILSLHPTFFILKVSLTIEQHGG